MNLISKALMASVS